jgi:NAD+ diphosphatase
MLQDIYPRLYKIEYGLYEPRENDYALLFKDDSVLLQNKRGKHIIPRFKAVKEICGEKNRAIYLFSVDKSRFFTAESNIGEIPADFALFPAEIFRGFSPLWLAFAAVSGKHLGKWYQDNAYCGKCAAKLRRSLKERALYCESCGNIIYPHIAPAVIGAVLHEDKILVARYRGRHFKGYALIAGFAEIGESLEDALHREVKEETGLKIKNARYYKSQPWGFSGSLLAGFFADLDGGDTIYPDGEELSEAFWMPRAQIPAAKRNISLTGEMLEAFRLGKTPPPRD